MSAHHHLIASHRVEGAPVFGADGHKLGTIDDLMIDKASGRCVYALMAYDGFLGVGERFFPVPWSLLSYDERRHGYAVPFDRDDLEKGHAVDDKEIEDEIEWREAVHAHYGAAPYWTGSPLY
jgi:hypothetical protein